MNSRNPLPIIPCTANTRARNSGGRLSLNTAIAALQTERMNTQSSMEPS